MSPNTGAEVSAALGQAHALGPLAAPGRVGRLLPFALVVGVSLAVTFFDADGHRAVLGAVSVVGAAAMGAGFVLPWQRFPRWWQSAAVLAPLLLCFVAVLYDGGTRSHFVPLMIVALMWIAVFESRAVLLIGLAISGGALVAGVAVAPEAESAVSAVVYAAVFGGLLPPVRHLVAEQRESVAALGAMADADSLTGLANRRGLERRTRDLVDSGAGGVGLVFVDLDGFKLINDVHGHDTGDELLVQVGDRLRAVTRQGDVVARVGGDEFVLVCQADPSALRDLAGRVDRVLRQPVFVLGEAEVSLRASVGSSHSPGPVHDIAALLASADRAMYRAKAAGHAGARPVALP